MGHQGERTPLRRDFRRGFLGLWPPPRSALGLLADDRHRAGGVVHDGMTDRAEREPLESTQPMGADDHETGLTGGMDERPGGTLLDQDGLHPGAGEPLLVTGQGLP